MRWVNMTTATVFLQFVLASVVLSQQMDLSELLDKCEKTQQNYAKIRVNEQALCKITDSRDENIPQWRKEVTDFSYDGERFNLVRKTWFDLSSADAPTPQASAQNYRMLWDGNRSFDNWYFSGNSMTELLGSKKIVVSSDKSRFGKTTAFYVGGPFLGIFAGDLKAFTDVLRASETLKLRENTESVGDSLCYVLEASGRDGKYTIWIDPEHGFNVAKARVRKTGNNVAYGRPMGTTKPPEGQDNDDRFELTDFSFDIDNVKFKQIDGLWVPVEGEFNIVTQYNDAFVMAEKRHLKRSLVDINPDFEAIGAFAVDLPNGTKIAMPEARGIAYMWRDGKIVPSLDSFVPKLLDYTVEQEKPTLKATLAANLADSQVRSERDDASVSTDKATSTSTDTGHRHHEQPPGSVSPGPGRWTLVFVGLLGIGILCRAELKAVKGKRQGVV